MAQLKVKQISDFVAAVGTIHNATVGTAAGTAIGDAKSEAISTAVSADAVVLSSAKSYADVAESDAVSTAAGDATTKANAAKSDAISTAVSADVVVKSQAISTAFSADVVLEGRLSTAISTEKARIDALLLDSEGTLDTFKEISDFITTLDTADIDGLTAAISTGDSTALSSAKSYADGLAGNYATADQGSLADSALQSYGDLGLNVTSEELDQLAGVVVGDILASNIRDFDAAGSADAAAATAESNAVATAASDATSKANAALASAKTYADTAESDAIASANGYTNTQIAALDLDLQGQIDLLSGVNSDEVIALFVNRTSFDAGKVFNLNGGHVAVFVNGLQIHEAAEGVDGWSSDNGQLFTVAGLGYDLEADDHIVVSGTLA
jgi:hypothetical protein